jgi:tetratricopeptide (TPR) repeat protein
VLGLLERPHFPSDRYAFIVGLLWSWLLAGLLYRLCLRINVRAIACGVSILILAALAGLSAGQIAVWQNTESLYVHILQTTPPQSPFRSRVAFMLGSMLIKDGLYPEAIGVVTTHLAVAPDDAFAHHVVGGWYFDVGDAEKAKFHYREAARLRPNEPAYYNDLGVLLVHRGETVVAHDFFERALTVDPNYPIACHNLGLLLAEQGKAEQAQALFARVQALRLMASR